jgi:hypothetical protein
MEFIVNNWEVIVGATIGFALAGGAIYKFVKLPKSKKMDKVNEWLLFAVVKAETEFGSGTGKAKLQYVYHLFTIKFPFLSKVISFNQFSDLVDKALEEVEEMLIKRK